MTVVADEGQGVITVGQVQTLVGLAIDTLTDVLNGNFETPDFEKARTRIAASGLVFGEFLQAPQITLPHPGGIFASGEQLQ